MNIDIHLQKSVSSDGDYMATLRFTWRHLSDIFPSTFGILFRLLDEKYVVDEDLLVTHPKFNSIMSEYSFVCINWRVCLFICLLICVFCWFEGFCLFVCLFVCLFICLFPCLFIVCRKSSTQKSTFSTMIT